MNKIKVLHFITSLTRGGKEKQLSTIVKYCENPLIENKILILNQVNTNYISEYSLENKVISIPNCIKIRKIISVYTLLKKEKPDILYCWGNFEAVITLPLSFKSNLKIINGSIRHGIRTRKLSQYFRTLILHISKYIVSNSYAGMKANNLNPLRKNRYVLYNGKEQKYSEKISYEERKKRLVKIFPKYENEIVFISVANLVPYKDYFTVLNALLELKSKRDFHYIIVGNGPLRKDIENSISALGLKNNVHLAGAVEDVLYYLQISDVLIHSSKGEGISNSILEAMFNKLIVVASNVGGVPETVFNKDLLFEYKNMLALYSILMNLDFEKEKRNMDTDDYENLLRKFTIESMLNRYEEIISKVYYD